VAFSERSLRNEEEKKKKMMVVMFDGDNVQNCTVALKSFEI
jgi:hypothetical protein